MASKIVKKVVPAKDALKNPIAAKADSAPKTRNAPPKVKKEVVNAETARVLRDAEAGKNLTSYVDEDDLFKKLGIKIGKAKA